MRARPKAASFSQIRETQNRLWVHAPEVSHIFGFHDPDPEMDPLTSSNYKGTIMGGGPAVGHTTDFCGSQRRPVLSRSHLLEILSWIEC